MDKSSIAILISFISVVFAATSLGWNIYRDVLLRPRVRLFVDKKVIVQQGTPPSPPYIGFWATNHGPGTVRLLSVMLLKTSLWRRLLRRQKMAILTLDHLNPYTGHLPTKLDVGESVDLFVNYDKDCFLQHDFNKVGITDTFGNSHWAPLKSIKRLRSKWLDEIGNQPT